MFSMVLSIGFLILFTLSLIIANFYCFITKKYLYLFIPCYLFLPDYYGIDFSTSLPILTVARIMAIFFYIYAFVNRKQDISLKNIRIKSLPKEYYFLIVYFSFRIFSNLRYITTYSSSAKTIGLLIFEHLFLIIAFYLLSPSKEEMNTLIKAIVTGATVLFICGVIESFTKIRIFDALYTVSREMLNDHYIRLGLMRSTASMSLPGFYGNMCIMMLPLILYLFDITKQKRYLVSAGLCIMAIIHSCCRSNLFFLFGLFVFAAVYVYTGEKRIQFLKYAAAVFCSLIVVMTILSLANPRYKYFYEGTAKSLLNEVGFNFDLDEDTPDGVEGFGGNPHGSASRLDEFGGIYYTISNHPVFGFGSGAEQRGDIKYYKFRVSKWYKHHAYDVGIVEIICDEGLLGLIGYLGIFIFILLTIRSIKNNDLKKYFYLLVLAYVTTTLSTGNMTHFLFLILIIFVHYKRFESTEIKMS